MIPEDLIGIYSVLEVTMVPGRLLPNQQEHPGPVGTPGEVICCASHNEVMISKDEDMRLAMHVGHHCPLSSIYTHSKHHMSSHRTCLTKTSLESVLAKLYVNLS